MSTRDATQIADRAQLRAYFIELFRAERGVDLRLAERLADRCVRRVKRIVVWKAPRGAEAERAASDLAAAGARIPDVEDVETVADAGLPPTSAEPPPPHPADPPPDPVPETVAAAPSPAPGPVTPDTALPAFDPYAFSAVVVLTKSGPEALMQRLAAITRAEHLLHLAEAQRLAVPRDLSGLDDLRSAILAAAQKRIQNRRAAAS